MYPQSMFLSRNKKNNVYPYKPQFYYIKVWFKVGRNYIGMFSRWYGEVPNRIVRCKYMTKGLFSRPMFNSKVTKTCHSKQKLFNWH